MLKSKKILFFVVLLTIVFFLSSSVFAAAFVYPVANTTPKKTDESSIAAEANATVVPEFSFQSAAQVLMEPMTGKILYAHNEHEKLLPASVTKIMTLILIMEQIDSGKLKYTDTVTCSANASGLGGSQIWFREGEKLTIDEALKCICVASANDVTVAMAELIGGTEQNFVRMMNEKAKALGMNDTVFKNSHGIDEDGHYTSAYDIALMSRELITKHSGIIKYTSIWMDTIRDGAFGLTNTNKLVRFYDGTIGLKTGSTSQALFNLSAVAKKENSTFIAVIMKGPTSDIRNEEAKQLLNYAFANYEVKKLYDEKSVIEKISVNKHVGVKVEVKNEINLSILISKGSKVETTQEIIYNPNLVAPIEPNSVIGKVVIRNKTTSEEIGGSNLVITERIGKSTLVDYYNEILNRFIMRT